MVLRFSMPPATPAGRYTHCLFRCRLCSSVSGISDLLLETEWMLPSPAAQVHTISLSPHRGPPLAPTPSSTQFAFSNDSHSADRSRGGGGVGGVGGVGGSGGPSFHVIRDDLLHPLANGNKARKLDALLPLLLRHSVSDVVTCGGCQSAHAAAVAVCCAEWGMKSHLLLRGEQLQVPTGYNLISLMFGNAIYVGRSVYAQREEMLRSHARTLAGDNGSVLWADEIVAKDVEGIGSVDMGCPRRVVIINEGAANVAALLGVIRLVKYLSETQLFRKEQRIQIVVDAGTGTTAVGLAFGAACLGLPWKVTAVMLVDTLEQYKEHERSLISDFTRTYQIGLRKMIVDKDEDSIVHWVRRFHPRKFGRVVDGEVDLCRQIARQTGILLDPIYTLAAWEEAVTLSLEVPNDSKVVMLHTGGTLGMFGLAQRYSSYFSSAEPS